MPNYHARFGGSNAGRWLSCTGYLRLADRLPRPPTNRAALEGTAQHSCMELILRDPDKTPAAFRGAVIDGVEITQQHVEAMNKANEAVDFILAHYSDNVDLFAERFVRFNAIDNEDSEPEAGGSADLFITDGRTAAVADFKFGQIEIGSGSTQNLFYLCAALRDFPAFQEAEVFHSWVIQPAYDPVAVLTTYSRLEVEQAALVFDSAINRNKYGAPEYVEGSHCAFCPATVACPVKLGHLRTLTATGDMIDLGDLAQWWLEFRELESTAAEIKQRLHHELDHGATIYGLKLVNRRTELQWRNEADRMAACMAAFPPRDAYRLLTPAQAGTIISSDVLAPLTRRPPGGTTIAPTGDPRPAVFAAGALGAALRRLT